VAFSTLPQNTKCAIFHYMKQKEYRFRLPEKLHKQYKLVCIENDLSMPAQTIDLIKRFVETIEENKRLTQC